MSKWPSGRLERRTAASGREFILSCELARSSIHALSTLVPRRAEFACPEKKTRRIKKKGARIEKKALYHLIA